MKSLALLLGVLFACCATGHAEETAASDAVAAVSLPGASQGVTIDRELLRDQAEAKAGEESLRQLVDFSLVAEKAASAGIAISDAEVSASIAESAKTDSTIKRIIQKGGVQQSALQRRTRYQIALDKLLTKNIKVDEAVVKKWFETRRKYFDQPERVRFGFLLTASRTRAHTMVGQLQTHYKTFSELVAEQKKSKDNLGRGSQAEVEQAILTSELPVTLKLAVGKLKLGQSSGVLKLQQGTQQAYTVVRLTYRQPRAKADFSQMKNQATLDYKLEQVARNLNKQNPTNPPFDRTLQQVSSYMAEQNGGALLGLREILSFINQTAVANLMSSLRAAAKVQVLDSAYTNVAKDFQPVPPTPK